MSLNSILYEIVNTHKYLPYVNVSGKRIISIYFNIGKFSCTIVNSTDDTNPDDNLHFVDKETYDKYFEQDNMPQIN